MADKPKFLSDFIGTLEDIFYISKNSYLKSTTSGIAVIDGNNVYFVIIASGVNFVAPGSSIKLIPAQNVGEVVYILPGEDTAISGYALKYNGDGQLTWGEVQATINSYFPS